MWIWTIRKGFEAFESKFEPLQSDSKHSNPNSNHSIGIRSIRIQIQTIGKGFKEFKSKFEPLERDSKHSNDISNIRIQIRTTQKGIEAF